MKHNKITQKESNIIEAAEFVFGNLGFKNAKMEDIAAKAGITKVTLYKYFQSKENLYLAVTYKALQLLVERYYNTLDKYKEEKGLESVIALFEIFMNFCEENYLYSEALLEYFSMIRSTESGTDDTKLTDAVKDSIYYLKLQDLQNLPFKLTVKEIERGKQDGSISQNVEPMIATLNGWISAVGYVKIVSASGRNVSPLFKVSLKEIKALNLRIARKMFVSFE